MSQVGVPQTKSYGYALLSCSPTPKDATGVALEELGKTPDGKKQVYETRMALQREVDGTRKGIRDQVRSATSTFECLPQHPFALPV